MYRRIYIVWKILSDHREIAIMLVYINKARDVEIYYVILYSEVE